MTAQLTELDPEMASLLLMGEAARAQGDYQLARRCYQQALELRPGHAAATLNLGVTLLELHEFADALRVLDAMEVRLRTDDGNGALIDVRLSARYNASLAHWYCAYAGDVTDVNELRLALTSGRQLTLDIADAQRRTDVPSDRRVLLETLEGATMALLGGIIVDALDAGLALGPAAVGVEITTESRPTGLVARLRSTPPGAEPPAPWLTRVASKAWYKPRTVPLLAEAARQAHDDDARTRYNLALLRARLFRKTIATFGESWVHENPSSCAALEEAFRDLSFAVGKDPTQAHWASRDLLIEPLRQLDHEQFRSVVGVSAASA